MIGPDETHRPFASREPENPAETPGGRGWEQGQGVCFLPDRWRCSERPCGRNGGCTRASFLDDDWLIVDAVLERLHLNENVWLDTITHFETLFCHAVGSPSAVAEVAQAMGRRLKGAAACRHFQFFRKRTEHDLIKLFRIHGCKSALRDTCSETCSSVSFAVNSIFIFWISFSKGALSRFQLR